MKISPGPGWSKGTNGNFYPHFFTYADFPGARTVAVVFKVLAWVVLASGALSAFEAAHALHDGGASNGNIVAVVAGIVGGTIIAASAMAFFAYVLQLLVAIHFDVRMEAASKEAKLLAHPA
jgi:hypothetical protein